jgi:hypothetical protein
MEGCGAKCEVKSVKQGTATLFTCILSAVVKLVLKVFAAQIFLEKHFGVSNAAKSPYTSCPHYSTVK